MERNNLEELLWNTLYEKRNNTPKDFCKKIEKLGEYVSEAPEGVNKDLLLDEAENKLIDNFFNDYFERVSDNLYNFLFTED